MKLESKKRVRQFDNILISFICCYFLLQSINLFFKIAIGEPQWWSLFSKIFLGFLLALVLLVIIRVKPKILFVEVILIILILIPVLFNTISYNYSELDTTIFNFYFVYMPLGFAIYMISNMGRAMRILYKFSWISMIILIATILLSKRNGVFVSSEEANNSYNMAIGYSLLLDSLLILDHFFIKKKLVDFLGVIASVVLIILFSSRTPLLCIFVYILLHLLKSPSVKRKTRRRAFNIIVLSIILVVIFYLFFAKSVYYSLFEAGYESTSLRKLLLNPLDDSSRFTIYSTYFDNIMQSPLFGYGILGGWTLNTYPHNIIIEIFLSFGLVFGVIIIGYGVLLLYNAINCKNQTMFRIVCVLCGYNFHLLLSSSYLKSITFCMLVAVCLKCTKASKKVYYNRPMTEIA